MTEFKWTEKRESAALQVAQDQQTDVVIASGLGISKMTLERWKLHPAFQARVAEHQAAFRTEITRRGIAEKQNRIDGMVRRHQALTEIIVDRAKAYADAPGGSTGLLVGKIELIKVYEPPRAADGTQERDDASGVLFSGKRYVEVMTYQIDAALLKECRELEKHIAQELGEWVDKQALTDSKGKDIDLAALVLTARQQPEDRTDGDTETDAGR